MLASLRNLKTSEIELRQPLRVLECEWLVGRLLAKQGIATAKWVGNTRRLLVEYDADICGGGGSHCPSAVLRRAGCRGPCGVAVSSARTWDAVRAGRYERTFAPSWSRANSCENRVRISAGATPVRPLNERITRSSPKSSSRTIAELTTVSP